MSLKYWAAYHPITLEVLDSYQWPTIQDGRSTELVHMEVLPPLDYRCVKAVRDQNTIIFVQDDDKYAIVHKYDIDNIRIERNKRLANCDWTQLADLPISQDKKDEWARYRQALRDFPSSIEDLSAPVWPVPPS